MKEEKLNEQNDIQALLDEAIIEKEPPQLLGQWRLRTLADAYQERPPVEYIIEGIFMLPSLNIVYGSPGSLKSMLLADAAVCVASGQDWLVPLPDHSGEAVKVIQAPVLWVDFDNGVHRTDERFDAMGQSRNLDKDTPLYYVSMPTPWLYASKRELVEEVAKLIQHLGARFVIVDNLGLISGGVNENESSMAEVMGNLRWLAEETGAAIVIIHHQRKGSIKGSRKGDSLRGHSSIEAAIDLALLLEREEGKEAIRVTATKERGPTVQPFSAQFAYDHKEGTKDLGKARFYSVSELTQQTMASEPTQQTMANVIVETLRDNGTMQKSHLVVAVRAKNPKLAINTVRNEIERLATANVIQQQDGIGTQKLYQVPETYRQLQPAV